MDPHDILENAPLPILVYQDGLIVYANKATIRMAGVLGYPLTAETIIGLPLYGFIVPEEHETALQLEKRILREESTAHNITRTLVDARGRRLNALGSATRILWKDCPAVEISFIILGGYALNALVGDRADPTGGLGIADARREALEHLAPRERQIAVLIASGYSTGNIVSQLGIKESTLRSHVKSIFRKTGVHSRTGLIRLVVGIR